jgi:16S rRNA (cytidine1402-2'-O)-methyltransferase
MIIYESPRRILSTLSDLVDVLGDRQIIVAREMTKIHEEFLRGMASEIVKALQGRELKGEITLLIEGGEPPSAPVELDNAVQALRKEGLSAKRTASVLADLTGESRKAIYKLAADIEPGKRGKGKR